MPTNNSESLPEPPPMPGPDSPPRPPDITDASSSMTGAGMSKLPGEGAQSYPSQSYFQGPPSYGYGGQYPMHNPAPYGSGGSGASGPFRTSMPPSAGPPPSYGYGGAYGPRSGYPYAPGFETGYFPSQQARMKASSPGRSTRGGHLGTSASSPRKGMPAVGSMPGAIKSEPEDRSDASALKASEDDAEIQRIRAAAEKELTTADVQPIRTDFHFFVNDMKDKLKPKAEEEVRKTNNGKLDLYLVNSNLNCRLMHAWEQLSESEREHYGKMEQDDRKRFTEEEEVASRHCATLTARAKSPDPEKETAVGESATENVSPSDHHDKERVAGHQERVAGHHDEQAGDQQSPTAEASGDNHNDESPPKKIKVGQD